MSRGLTMRSVTRHWAKEKIKTVCVSYFANKPTIVDLSHVAGSQVTAVANAIMDVITAITRPKTRKV